MKTIAAIRTHRWTAYEERLLAALRAHFGDDVCVVFHNRPKDMNLPCDVVDLTEEWAAGQGLRVVSDMGWRCGDFFYYALRHAKPDYDYYWLVEPDVLFTGDTSAFFSNFDDVTTDLLGLNPEQITDPNAFFVGSLMHIERWRAIFALTRMSGRALDWLEDERRENAKFPIRPFQSANDELFVFSNIKASDQFEMGNLRDHAPTWFDGAHFDTNPDVLDLSLMHDPSMANKAHHPVRGLEDFKAEVAHRVAKRTFFMKKIGKSWDHISDADLIDISDMARNEILDSLRGYKAEHKEPAG